LGRRVYVGEDHIDLSAFYTNFDALLDRDNHWAGREGHDDHDGPVTLKTEGHDTVLAVADGGTVRIEGYPPARERLCEFFRAATATVSARNFEAIALDTSTIAGRPWPRSSPSNECGHPGPRSSGHANLQKFITGQEWPVFSLSLYPVKNVMGSCFVGCFCLRSVVFGHDADTTDPTILRAGHRYDLIFYLALDDGLCFPTLPAGRNGRSERALFEAGSVFVLCSSATAGWLVGYRRSPETITSSDL
jgi:hypothetical protein